MNPPDPHALTATHDASINAARAALNGTYATDNEIALAAAMIERGTPPGLIANMAMRVRALPR